MTFCPRRYRRSIVAMFERDMNRTYRMMKQEPEPLSKPTLLALDCVAASALKLSASVNELIEPLPAITGDDELRWAIWLRCHVRERLARLDCRKETGGPQ